MFKLFSGEAADEKSWPMREVVAALKNRFSDVDSLGEDGPLKVYGVTDNGINFVVALMQTGPGSQQVAELGFLARLDGPLVAQNATVENVAAINRNLHISVASMEGADLFLMAGMQVVGTFDEGQFNLILEQWRRDLVVCIHGIHGEAASLVDAFPAAKLEAARNFATNTLSPCDGQGDIDVLATFMGAARANQAVCDECGGRGKRGLIARMCEACDGEGFVDGRR